MIEAVLWLREAKKYYYEQQAILLYFILNIIQNTSIYEHLLMHLFFILIMLVLDKISTQSAKYYIWIHIP